MWITIWEGKNRRIKISERGFYDYHAALRFCDRALKACSIRSYREAEREVGSIGGWIFGWCG